MRALKEQGVGEGSNDVAVLRDLAKEYADIAGEDIQEERRALWRAHHSLKATRAPVLVSFGMHNVWCREMFCDGRMRCADPFYRGYERLLRMQVFHHSLGDDFVAEPWISVGASCRTHPSGLWGLKEQRVESEVEGGSWKADPPVKEWSDADKLVIPRHEIDEAATARNVARLEDAIGDILEVDASRGCAFMDFDADISTHLGALRGLEQIMIDMYDSPEELHKMLAFMRDAILAIQDAAEAAGDFSLTTQKNQAMTYAQDLPSPRASRPGRPRKDLWCHCAAQEFTLISPAMHEEFLLQYQLPIIEKWGLVAYGCCEDLTEKIDMLRGIANLRTIAVTPVADVAKCAQRIGDDYVFSWRPNPTDMVSCGFDEARIRRIIGEGMDAAKHCRVHICLKDVETVEGNPERLSTWVGLVRAITEEYA